MSGAMTLAAMLRNLGEQSAVRRAKEARQAERRDLGGPHSSRSASSSAMTSRSLGRPASRFA
jgi:hypothetical protein